MGKLQLCSPLEQSAREVLLDNSRCPSGMLTLTHPVQLVPRKDHARNTPRPPDIHLHWWKAHIQPTDDSDLMGGSNVELRDLTSLPALPSTPLEGDLC